MSMKHRRTRSSNDLHNLLNTSTDKRLIRLTSLSPSFHEANIAKLVKASARQQQQKIVFVQNLEANFPKAHLTELQFGKSTYNKSRGQWSDVQNLALFCIPEGNSTIDTVSPQSPKELKKGTQRKQIKITKKLQSKLTIQRAKSKDKIPPFKKTALPKTASIASFLGEKSKLHRALEATVIKRKVAKSYF